VKRSKNKPISVSLTSKQIEWIDGHPTFSVSKFVQIMIDDHVISLANDIQTIEKEEQ